MLDLKSYPTMKDSGVRWLRDVPAGWEVRRNGRLFAERKETGFPVLPILEVSLKTGVRIRDFGLSQRKQVMADRDKYKRAASGDIAYNMMRMWQGAVGVAPTDGLVSPAYVVARPLPGTVPGYFAYLYRTSAYMGEVNNYSHGIVADRNRLYWDEFKQIPTPYPPPDEQSAIVRFLDHAGRRIREYIRAKQKLIKLLGEQKQVIIHRAVTRGLNPNVRLKPSGVEWLDDVPEHWEVVLNQRIFKEEIRPHGGKPETQLSLSQKDGLIATSEMQERSLQTSTYNNWKLALPGDLVLNRFKAHLGVFFASTLRGIVSFHYGVFAPRRELVVKYFELLYHTNVYRTIYAGRSNGMTVGLQNLSNQNFYNVRSVVPPVQEQAKIVSFIEKASERLNEAVKAARREIALVREYRTRLIADVVTGKLDVREAAADLPAETEEAKLPLASSELDDDADVDPSNGDSELEE
jgi:type I restriction enzyme S subunit